ncbi:60S ribosomal protein L10a-2-like, partial [Impatiens glandulifera]|uniref:60S ribosomal protein L10a-2-like n=1 Tax=Impatiens glandulifera TaxID=253017 RepID=UPI001FB1002E
LQSDALREAITQISTDAKEKKCNFTETDELQIGLKNYDLQKDKRFSGSVKLPHIPRPKMKVCMLGDAQHIVECANLSLGRRFSPEPEVLLRILCLVTLIMY